MSPRRSHRPVPPRSRDAGAAARSGRGRGGRSGRSDLGGMAPQPIVGRRHSRSAERIVVIVGNRPSRGEDYRAAGRPWPRPRRSQPPRAVPNAVGRSDRPLSGPASAGSYDGAVRPPTSQPDWLGVGDAPLPVADAGAWVVLPRCGAVVSFSGTARDHSDRPRRGRAARVRGLRGPGRPPAGPARRLWPGRPGPIWAASPCSTGPAASRWATLPWWWPCLHPIVTHAFEAARYLIDELKRSVPIWKRERWNDGESWGLEAQHIEDPGPPRDEASAP